MPWKRAIGAMIAATAILTPLIAIKARVAAIIIDSRESPTYAGRSFGEVGQYEKLTGRFLGELDPGDPHDAVITDIALAPRNAGGMVEYASSFTIVKPIDMTKGNGILIDDIPNRGLRLMFDHAGVGPGDGYFMEHGYTILWNGWQGDVAPGDYGPDIVVETASAPVAKRPGGDTITGPVLKQIRVFRPTPSVALPKYEPASMDVANARLTEQIRPGKPPIDIPASDFAFADCTSTPFPGTPDPTQICYRSGFDPNVYYELVYKAKDPKVLGIGFAATRDVAAFLRHETADRGGTPNPLAGAISTVIVQGKSQSGNFIRTFITLGFNQDEDRRLVFDGANPHIAARQLALNIRFAVPGGDASPGYPGSEGVLTWADSYDPPRKLELGMLDRCLATDTCPKIVETLGSTEFWNLRASPGFVGKDAAGDIPLPPNVRRYYFPATTHGGGDGLTKPPAAVPGCLMAANPNPESDQMRAIFADLVAWVVDGTEPPPSAYPMLADNALTPPDRSGFPEIPGIPFTPRLLNPVVDYDFGADFDYARESGIISVQPPRVKSVLPTLVPTVDADGNEFSGIKSTLLAAPLGTYTGWNIRTQGFDKGGGCGYTGGFVPFAATKAERDAKGDPRASLEERYASHDAYVARVRAAAARQVSERFLLPADAERLVREAEDSAVMR